ncbi:hypothetical protein FNF29_03470 [Cafeteria roenbergensis]|uniref:Protein kinase domain-containing protein n=1 Tax=Cafeteria roenbergensis TaxID=33653 RepID=A0A5A8CIV5_CAFRO|nr:hypothetical protein FNF29_03470 [Cafeteria roenbergensis]|eukprot:KAA0152946.1 hypothetical protein FNF29_03470 [Cafeteria roenbergensis]
MGLSDVLRRGLAGERSDTAAITALSWRLLPLQDRLQLLADAAHGIAHLHARKLMHRDVKPANIFLRGAQACIGDFGSAKSFRGRRADEATMSGPLGRAASEDGDGDGSTSCAPSSLLVRLGSSSSVSAPAVGTDAFIAPELWARASDASAAAAVGPAVDAWSFGMTVLAVLGGLVDGDTPLAVAAAANGLAGASVQQLVCEHRLRPCLSDLIAAGLVPAGTGAKSDQASGPDATPWTCVADLVERCLQTDPAARPSLTSCAAQLQTASSLCCGADLGSERH